jgi:hypothetical protein
MSELPEDPSRSTAMASLALHVTVFRTLVREGEEMPVPSLLGGAPSLRAQKFPATIN